MRESRSSGSVRGAASDGRPYRERMRPGRTTGWNVSTQPDCHILVYGDLGDRTRHWSSEDGVIQKVRGLENGDGTS